MQHDPSRPGDAIAARVNARDAIEMLDAFRNPEDGDIPQGQKLAAAIQSIEAAVRQSVGGEGGTQEWIAQRLLADAARILELAADPDGEQGGQRNRQTAEIIARRYEGIV